MFNSLRDEINEARAFRRGTYNPADEVNEEINFQMAECAQRIEEVVEQVRQRSEGAIEHLTSLAEEFAAIDPMSAVTPLLQEVTHSYRVLQIAEEKSSEILKEQKAYLDTLENNQALFQLALKNLMDKLDQTPKRSKHEDFVVEVGEKSVKRINKGS